MTSKTLIFFGSGPVAAATLQSLLDAGFEFEAIITKPRAPHHRGDVPVLELTRQHNLTTFTPQSKQELSDLFSHHKFTSPVGLVVDYGIIIASEVIDSFAKGIINSHFSLLPQWRGADPITFSLLSGQPQGGVSIMLINERLDEGLLLAHKPLPIADDTNIGQLTDQLVALSNSMLIEVIPKYLAGQITAYPQPDQPPTYSRKLTKDDGLMDLTKPAEQLEREIRAYLGWPKSRVTIFGQPVIVLRGRVAANQQDGALILACGNNTWLEVLELTGPSGKRMDGAAFVRGYGK